MNNMKQLGLALGSYTNDYDSGFPFNSENSILYFHPDLKGTWSFTLMPYLSNSHPVLICPADPRGDQRLAQDGGTSYVINGYFSGLDQRNAFGKLISVAYTMDGLARPAETITFFEGSDVNDVGFTGDHVHTNWVGSPTQNWGNILTDIAPDRHRVGTGNKNSKGADRAEGVANYLYADGHVKAIPALQIKSWADSNYDFQKPLGN